jgi:hypothetical protein
MKTENEMIPVPDYPGYYCNRVGKLFSDKKIGMKTGIREIQGSPDKDGYLKVTLLDVNGKSKYLRKHRIIASVLLGKSLLQVNHINGNKQDNRVENLEYVTIRENQCHRRKMSGNKIGVCWAKKERKWRAYIQHNKKWENLGFYDNENDAKTAYINRLSELKIQNKYAF